MKVASMHIEGAVAHWFQSTDRRFIHASWDTFCTMIHDHFDRDQQEALIRQYELFHIHQVGIITRYV
jgi:hypothetical protein